MHLARIFDCVKSREIVQLNGNNGISINPIHVEDATEVLLSLIDRPLSAVINVAGYDVYTIRQIADIFGIFLNTKPNFNISNIPAENLIADISLMKSKLILHFLRQQSRGTRVITPITF
jgi:nucleoside-diphosphate-sugar epimerase